MEKDGQKRTGREEQEAKWWMLSNFQNILNCVERYAYYANWRFSCLLFLPVYMYLLA